MSNHRTHKGFFKLVSDHLLGHTNWAKICWTFQYPVRRGGWLRGRERRSRLPANQLHTQWVQGESDDHDIDHNDDHGDDGDLGDDDDHADDVDHGDDDDHGVNDDHTWRLVWERHLHLYQLGLWWWLWLSRGRGWDWLQGNASKFDTGGNYHILLPNS